MNLGLLINPKAIPNLCDFNFICRVCLCREDEMQPILSFKDKWNPENELNLREKMRMCSDIVVEENEELLPTKICERCVNLLLIAHYFKILCTKSDKVLRQILTNASSHNETNVKKDNNAHDGWEEGGIEETRDDVLLKQDVSSDGKVHLSFCNEDEFRNHTESSQNDGEAYKCFGCDKVFQRYPERTHHEKYFCPKMPPGTKYECGKCGEKCENRFRFDSHLKYGCGFKPAASKRSPPKSRPAIKCPHCDLTLLNKSTLRVHILKRHTEDKPYVCEVCGKGYTTVGSLNVHQKQTHSEDKNYKCPHCPYAAKQKSSLNVHMRRHTLECKYWCEVCGAGFKQNTAYHVHARRYHKEKEYQCEMCQKMFSEKRKMKEHVSCVHLGLKPHVCKECGAAYTNKKSYRAHLLRVHDVTLPCNSLYQKVVRIVNTVGHVT